MNYKIANKRLINGPLTINYDILQRLSFEVDLNNEETLEGFYIAAGLQLHAPGSSLLFYSSDAEYASGVLSFNVNTYTENFLNNVTKIGTKAYLEIAQMQDNYKEVLLFDDIIVEPRVYSEGMTPEPIDPSEWATRSWVLGTFEKKITEDRKLSYDLISGAPEVGSGTIILTQGGVEKGRFNVNQSGDFSIDFDLGPEGSVTSSWVDANYEKRINENRKLSYSLVSGAPDIPTKTSQLTNDSGFTTQAWVNLQLLSYQKQITVNNKLNYSYISGVPDFALKTYVDQQDALKQNLITSNSKLDYSLISGAPEIPSVGSGTVTISINGIASSFNVNQSADTTIEYTVEGGGGGVTSAWVEDNFEPIISNNRKLNYSYISGVPDFALKTYVDQQDSLKQNLITNSNKIDYSLISGAPEIPEVGSGSVTISINGVASSFNVNQSANSTIEYTVQGGGGLIDERRPFMISTSDQLCADWTHNYIWGLVGQPGAILYVTNPGSINGEEASYQTLIDINLSGSTVTLCGATMRGALFDGCLNRCILTMDAYDKVLYTYDILSARPMIHQAWAEWTLEGQDSVTFAAAAGYYEFDGTKYTNIDTPAYTIEQAGTNWRLLMMKDDMQYEIAMGPESNYNAFGTYGTVGDWSLPELHADSIITLRSHWTII